MALKLSRMLMQRDFDLRTDSYDDLINYLALAQEFCGNFEIIIKDFRTSKAYVYWVCNTAKKEHLDDFLKIHLKVFEEELLDEHKGLKCLKEGKDR